MMFDWDDEDQVGDTIWGEFSESENHIVPYTKDTEENALFTYGDYSKKQKNEEASAVGRPTEQTSRAKNYFPACNLENTSTFNTNEELSAPRLDTDTWPDFPALSAAFGNGYTATNYRDSVATKLVNDFSKVHKLNKERGNMKEYDHSCALLQCKDSSALNGTCSFSTGGTVQLDGESDLFSNVHEDKENDSFLDCDWANIGDFDDLDRIFRNDYIFGHDKVGSGDEFLSPSTDVITSTAQSIPMPDIPLNRDQSSEQGCSSFQFIEHSGGKRKPEEKTADSFVRTGDQTVCQTQLTSEYGGTNNQFTEKEDKQKKLLRPRKKAEEKSKNKSSSQNLNGAWSHNINHSQQFLSPKFHPSVTLPTFQSPTTSQQKQLGDVEPMGCLGSYNQPMLSGYGYSPFHFPAFPLVPCIHDERNQMKLVAVGHKFYPDPSKHSNYLAQVPDVLSRPLTMTPQEKVEKLRRRQQKQAMLAIQQQQQQLGHQITVADRLVPQSCPQKNQSQDAVTSTIGVEESAKKLLSSDLNMLVEHDESLTSALIDDHYLEETTYYQLEDALGKLDTRIRLCIRDSLFRLARSAVERQSASDRSSTNKSSRDEDEIPANEEINNQNRCTRVADAETDTNPIDRTVAHLLFHRPSESCLRPVKDEIPQSPILYNPAPKVSLVTHGSNSERCPEYFEEMEVQPSI